MKRRLPSRAYIRTCCFLSTHRQCFKANEPPIPQRFGVLRTSVAPGIGAAMVRFRPASVRSDPAACAGRSIHSLLNRWGLSETRAAIQALFEAEPQPEWPVFLHGTGMRQRVYLQTGCNLSMDTPGIHYSSRELRVDRPSAIAIGPTHVAE